MKIRYIFLLLMAGVVLAVSCGRGNNDTSADVAAGSEQVADSLSAGKNMLPSLDSLRCVEGKVRNGQFFSSLLTGLGMTQNEAYDITQACDTVFDVKTLRVGQTYRAYYDSASGQEFLKYLIYDRDKASCVVFECEEPYDV